MEHITRQKPKARRILFTGLDGAGKSSIIMALQQEFSKISSTEPSNGAQGRFFSLMGRQIVDWDLGGQESYRIAYLRNPNKFFDDTEIAIYVIDIQNVERISESLSYLRDVILTFKKLRINPPVNIFFHKSDPKLIESQDLVINDDVIQELIRTIKNLSVGTEFHFFKTSIFDLYSIVQAMSEILLELYPKSDLINKSIEEFAKKLDCEGIIIIDDNSLIIGSYYENNYAKELLHNSIGLFISLNDSFSTLGTNRDEDQIVINKMNKYFVFKQLFLDDRYPKYYGLMLKGKSPFNLQLLQDDYNAFTQIISEIIKR